MAGGCPTGDGEEQPSPGCGDCPQVSPGPSSLVGAGGSPPAGVSGHGAELLAPPGHPLPGRAAVGCAMRWDLATSSEAGWSYSHPTREATTPRLHLSLWISLFPSRSARKKQPGGSHPGGAGGGEQSQVSERHMPKEWPRWQLSSPTQPKTKGRRDMGGHLPAACLLRRFQLQPSHRDGVSPLPPWLNLTVTPQPVPCQWARGNPPFAGFTSAGGRWGLLSVPGLGQGGHLSPLFLRVTPAPTTPAS